MYTLQNKLNKRTIVYTMQDEILKHTKKSFKEIKNSENL
jgi:hypothetical protein